MRNTSSEKDTFWSDLAELPGQTSLAGLRIAVAAGGIGPEREISLQSGNAVWEALRSTVPGAFLVNLETSEPGEVVRQFREYDLVFTALHGHFGEDGGFQSILESAGITFTGSDAASSEEAFDKRLSKEAFDKAGIPSPEYTSIGGPEAEDAGSCAEMIMEAPGLPAVVKPACSGSSVGVTIVKEKDALVQAVRSALSGCPPGRRAIVAEKFIEGREVTLGVLADRALPIIGLAPAKGFFDYEAKYTDGVTCYEVPAKLEPRTAERISKAGLCAFHTLGCRDYARVDLMLDREGNPFVLEVNTIPGMTSHSLLPKAAAVVGLDFPLLVSVMAALAYRREANAGN